MRLCLGAFDHDIILCGVINVCSPPGRVSGDTASQWGGLPHWDAQDPHCQVITCLSFSFLLFLTISLSGDEMYDVEGKGDKFMPFHRAGYDTKTGQVPRLSKPDIPTTQSNRWGITDSNCLSCWLTDQCTQYIVLGTGTSAGTGTSSGARPGTRQLSMVVSITSHWYPGTFACSGTSSGAVNGDQRYLPLESIPTDVRPFLATLKSSSLKRLGI